MNKIKVLFYGTGALLLLVGIGACPAGLGFIMDPDGSSVGIPIDLLADSPFEDFLIPGILLLTVHGIGSLAGSLLVFKRHRLSGQFTTLLGIAMLIWISSQVYWIGWESWLQFVFFGVGVVELLLGYLINNEGQDHTINDDMHSPKTHAH